MKANSEIKKRWSLAVLIFLLMHIPSKISLGADPEGGFDINGVTGLITDRPIGQLDEIFTPRNRPGLSFLEYVTYVEAGEVPPEFTILEHHFRPFRNLERLNCQVVYDLAPGNSPLVLDLRKLGVNATGIDFQKNLGAHVIGGVDLTRALPQGLPPAKEVFSTFGPASYLEFGREARARVIQNAASLLDSDGLLHIGPFGESEAATLALFEEAGVEVVARYNPPGLEHLAYTVRRKPTPDTLPSNARQALRRFDIGNAPCGCPATGGRASLLPTLLTGLSAATLDYQMAEMMPPGEDRDQFLNGNPVAQGRSYVGDATGASDFLSLAQAAALSQADLTDKIEAGADVPQDVGTITRFLYYFNNGRPLPPAIIEPPIPMAPPLDQNGKEVLPKLNLKPPVRYGDYFDN